MLHERPSQKETSACGLTEDVGGFRFGNRGFQVDAMAGEDQHLFLLRIQGPRGATVPPRSRVSTEVPARFAGVLSLGFCPSEL